MARGIETMEYEILDHTADAKFRAKGESLEDAFKGVVKAFSEITGGEGGQHRHSIEVESESYDALLFDFLDELIFLQDVENVVVSHVDEIEIEQIGHEPDKKHHLEVTVWTNPITGAMSPTDVKAPTYSEMDVNYEQGEGWVLTAVLDL